MGLSGLFSPASPFPPDPDAPIMKLHATAPSLHHAITGHARGEVRVNGRPLRASCIVTPERLIERWPPASFESLAAADLEVLAGLGCPVILLGTGDRQRFPAPALLRPLQAAGIGVEVMDTPAACRTYNILMTEGRAVAAALIVEAA